MQHHLVPRSIALSAVFVALSTAVLHEVAMAGDAAPLIIPAPGSQSNSVPPPRSVPTGRPAQTVGTESRVDLGIGAVGGRLDTNLYRSAGPTEASQLKVDGLSARRGLVEVAPKDGSVDVRVSVEAQLPRGLKASVSGARLQSQVGDVTATEHRLGIEAQAGTRFGSIEGSRSETVLGNGDLAARGGGLSVAGGHKASLGTPSGQGEVDVKAEATGRIDGRVRYTRNDDGVNVHASEAAYRREYGETVDRVVLDQGGQCPVSSTIKTSSWTCGAGAGLSVGLTSKTSGRGFGMDVARVEASAGWDRSTSAAEDALADVERMPAEQRSALAEKARRRLQALRSRNEATVRNQAEVRDTSPDADRTRQDTASPMLDVTAITRMLGSSGLQAAPRATQPLYAPGAYYQPLRGYSLGPSTPPKISTPAAPAAGGRTWWVDQAKSCSPDCR